MTAVPTAEENEYDDDESSSSESLDSTETERKAPLQLLVETVAALVREEFDVARKLCQMIILYEPDHPKAAEILKLIEEKEQLKQEAEEEGEDEDNDDEDEDSDSDSEDDSDTTSDEEQSSAEIESNTEAEQKKIN